MTNRRDFLLLALCAPALANRAVAQSRVVRLGILSGLPRAKSLITPLVLRHMAAKGYVEGKSMQVEFRSADGVIDRYAALARELVDAKCDVIVPLANLASAQALSRIKTTVPVVLFASEYDPVEAGIIKSLARPGGNITGVFAPASLLLAKNLEIAAEVVPDAKTILVLSDAVSKPQLPELRKAAMSRGITLALVEYDKQPYDLSQALDVARKAKAAAAIIPLSPVFASMRSEMSKLVTSASLPAFVPPFMVNDAGSLLSYGVDFAQLANRAAGVADRILKGANPASIAVEEVSEFRLTINMRTARALGLKLPYSVLARANALIE